MPTYYLDGDVEVRSEPSFNVEARDEFSLDERGLGAGDVADIAEMIVNVVKSIKAGIAADKNVGMTINISRHYSNPSRSLIEPKSIYTGSSRTNEFTEF